MQWSRLAEVLAFSVALSLLFSSAIPWTPIQWKFRRRRRVVGVIPARYQSFRFPGKPLIDICGKPMIVRTWEQAMKAKELDAVYVATDNSMIADACQSAGALVVMTSASCPNGTERCNEAVNKLKKAYDIVINIQGDEPLIEPGVIDAVVRALRDDPAAVYSTACTPLPLEQVRQRSRVKCVVDRAGYALYFSRGALPASKHAEPRPFPAPFADQPYLLHLGLQCYERDFLAQYCQMPATPLMAMEDLEQLKVLENGYKMRVVVVDHCAHGVDEPGDVAAVEEVLRKQWSAALDGQAHVTSGQGSSCSASTDIVQSTA